MSKIKIWTQALRVWEGKQRTHVAFSLTEEEPLTNKLLTIVWEQVVKELQTVKTA